MPKVADRPSLADRYGMPPFSVLDTRSGAWQKRKRQWLALGIDGAAGREVSGRCFRQDLARGEHIVGAGPGKNPEASGTSIFDPVLCELAYRWFSPPGGHVLDPFAGEATKGIVAAYLGHPYTGIELRPEQVKANRSQAATIGVTPRWICGDSEHLDSLLPADAHYDLIFTSPPYYDLEIYSASDRDGSAFATYRKFIAWYERIFAAAVARLADNRFVVVKVGEIRDRRGVYRNFVGDNVRIFTALGLAFYNEAVLLTMIGSLPVRVAGQFSPARKLGKAHQNVLVFYKGDPRRVRDHFPPDTPGVDLPG